MSSSCSAQLASRVGQGRKHSTTVSLRYRSIDHGEGTSLGGRCLRRRARVRRALARQRPRHAPGRLRRRPGVPDQAEWVPVQGERDGGRLLLRGAQEPGEHQQPGGVDGDGSERAVVPGGEHAGRVHGADRLRAGRPEPAAHPPARHRDHLRPRGRPRGGLHHHRQQALHQDRHHGRGLRLPAGARPLPAEPRPRPRRRHRRLQQPAPGHPGHRRHALRRRPAGLLRRARQGLPRRHRAGERHQGQVQVIDRSK